MTGVGGDKGRSQRRLQHRPIHFESAGLRDLQRQRILGILTPHQEGVFHPLSGLEQHQSGRRAVIVFQRRRETLPSRAVR